MTKTPPLTSFIQTDIDSDFPIQNLPYGIIRPPGQAPRVAVAIGDFALDLSALAKEGLIKTDDGAGAVFEQSSLNAFAKMGRKAWSSVRLQIQNLLTAENPTLRDNAPLRQRALIPLNELELLLPFAIGGFTDFYASQIHATNLGRIYRGEENALLPNWKHIPIAYNGRASSVVVSGTAIVRPQGQIKAPTAPAPTFEPTQKLDMEVEIGFFVGQDSPLGRPIKMKEVADYIFGVVLVNDWSARDIQAWEYQPLGPFLGKSFATTVSPWVVPLEALSSAQFQMPSHDPAPLPYLSGPQVGYDIEISAELKPQGTSESTTICQTNSKHLYWSFAQQLVHHSSNGCPMRVGDLLASGTISGPEPENWGSFVERSLNGKQTIALKNGETRTFLKNGDEVTLKAASRSNGYKIGFGAAVGRIQENQQ